MQKRCKGRNVGLFNTRKMRYLLLILFCCGLVFSQIHGVTFLAGQISARLHQIFSKQIFSEQTFDGRVLFAESADVENIVVYSDDGHYLFERVGVVVGDEYMTRNFEKYIVVSVDENYMIGVAKFVGLVEKPAIDFSLLPAPISDKVKKIALYMTHNAESYVPTDGVDSIYGEGGIHDVAKNIKYHLQLLGVEVSLDETLHIPHDAAAYSRSRTTASKLLQDFKPDAIFDIHRDGTSRKSYVTTVNDREHCMVRIVVGKANANMAVNETFAIYLLTVAQELYPWLIKDIFYATGHYNQHLYNKALLFEMGTYLVEKDLVYKSVGPLTEVVTTALYGTTVNAETGSLTINGSDSGVEKTINEALNDMDSQNSFAIVVFGIVVGVVILAFVVWAMRERFSKD